MFEVKTQQFSGPMDKLLQLIEEKHLDITRVNLAEVTADFLKYVKELGSPSTSSGAKDSLVPERGRGATYGVSPGTLADFLVVAAKLVLIKSKVLLPMLELTQEEEEDIHDLEARLRIYREFKEASIHIQKLWDKNRVAYGRPLLASLGDQSIFYPPPKLGVSDLVRSLQNLAATLQAFLPDTQKIKKAVFTIEQKIEELLNRFREAGGHTFKTLSQQKEKGEVIALFLAVLHLLKDRMVKVEQSNEFGEILIEKSR